MSAPMKFVPDPDFVVSMNAAVARPQATRESKP
jgi:hypothetical protein